MPDLDSCIPLPLDETVLAEVVAKAKDWAIMHGAAMRSKADFNPDALQVSFKCSFSMFLQQNRLFEQ